MKKVGILTFHRANNYGAVLQTYALKTTLNNLGCEAKVINYLCPKIENDYAFFSGKISIMWFIKKLVKFLLIPILIRNKSKFSCFRDKYLIDTLCIKPNQMAQLNNQYDIFITGSDQVFNIRLTNFDKNYFLDFVNDKNKKYSYAASLGLSELDDNQKSFINKELSTFSAISVRENKAKEIISKLTNCKVETHLDPTLLFDKQEWSKLISKNTKKEDYILLYLININDKIINYVKNLSKKTGLKIVYISYEFLNKTGIRSICVTPQDWVEYFINAKYIVTNSFHGLAFSINFNKTFFIDLSPSTTFKVNSRITNLLNLTGLTNRLIDNIGTNYDMPIDWADVNKKLNVEREKSLEYLRSICGKN